MYHVNINGIDSGYNLSEESLKDTITTVINFGGDCFSVGGEYVVTLPNGDLHIMSKVS